MVTKRLVKSKTKWRLWIFATTITLATLLGYLETQGIQTWHSGDMVCGGKIICDGLFDINVPIKMSNYLGESINITELCFGKNINIVVDNVYNLSIYKADKRYGVNNPNRWKPFNFTGNCLPIGNNSFKINATKDEFSIVKWAVSNTNIDPYWYGIEKVTTCIRTEGTTDCKNDDGTRTLSIGQANVWDGKEWVDGDRLSEIVNVSYSDGTINISSSYFSYIIDVSINDGEKDYKLKDFPVKSALNIIDDKSAMEFALNISDIPKAVEGKLSHINFAHKKSGDLKNIEIAYSDLTRSGYELSEGKDVIQIGNLQAKLSSGSLYLDPLVTLGNGNVTADTTLNASASATYGDYGLMVTMTAHWVSATNRKTPILKVGISSLPANATITEARLFLRVADSNLDSGETFNYDVHHVYNQSSYNIGGAEWTEGNVAPTSSCTVNGGAASGTEIYWGNMPTTSSQMNLTYESRVTSADGGVAAHWNNWSIIKMLQTEYNSGGKNLTILLNVTRGAGSPDNSDCATIDSAEAATATSRPFINITYTTPDITNPTYSLNSTNSTYAGFSTKFSLYWQDTVGLSGYNFSFCNGSWIGSVCTAGWINDTWVAMTGTGNWSNVTKSVNSTIGSIIAWCVKANDTSNNWNTSSCNNPFNYTTQEAPYPPTIVNQQSYTNWSAGLGFNVTATADDGNGLDDITNCYLFSKRKYDNYGVQYTYTNKTGVYNSGNGNCTSNISTSDGSIVVMTNNTGITDSVYNGGLLKDEINDIIWMCSQYIRITKINATTGEVIAIAYPTGGSCTRLVQDDNFLYVGDSDGRLIKLNKTDMSFTETATGMNVKNPSLEIDDVGDDRGIYYMNSSGTGKYMIKVNASNITQQLWQIDTGATAVQDIATNDNIPAVYTAGQLNVVKKINKTDGAIDCTVADPGDSSSSAEYDSWLGNLWVGGYYERLRYINVTSCATLQTATLGPSGDAIFDVRVDADFVYTFAYISTGGRIRQFNKTKFVSGNFTNEWNYSFAYDIRAGYVDSSYVYFVPINSPLTVYKFFKSSTNYTVGENITTKMRFVDSTSQIVETTNGSKIIPPVSEVGPDITPPTLAIQLPENTTYGYNISLPLNYTASDVSGVSQCWYNLDGGSNTTITSCANTTFNTSIGSHRLYLFVNDTLGNNATANVNFTIDFFIECNNLTVAGKTYYLGSNITNLTTTKCIIISNDNITLDCQGNIIRGAGTASTSGIYIDSRRNILVRNCYVSTWGSGITPNSNTNLTFINNFINGTEYGFNFYYSPNNIIINNTINNTAYSINFLSGFNSTLVNNTIFHFLNKQSGLIITGTSINDFRGSINESNTVNSLPIYYIDGVIRQCQNNTIYTNGSLYSTMVFVGCSNITVRDSSPVDSIIFAVTTGSRLLNLNLSNVDIGLSLQANSNYNTIINVTNNYDINGYQIVGSSLNNFTNCTAINNNWAIRLDSTSNNNRFIDGIINSSTQYGILISAGNNNIFENISILNSVTYDYYLSNTNNFTNTDFKSARKIYFSSDSWFNYKNTSDSSIWLKNRLSDVKTVIRTINSWSNLNLTWNESITSGTTIAYYNITGLLPNTNYEVYNFSVLAYTITTDANGDLNFTINLNTTARIIQVNSTITSDTTSPTLIISLPANTTYNYNTSLPLNYTATDNVNISQCKFNLDNGANTTLTNCVNATFNTSEGSHRLYLFANDTVNNNATANVNFSIDMMAPVKPVIQSPTNITYNTTSVNLNYTVPSDRDQCKYELDWSNTTSATCANQTMSSLSQGSHNVAVWINDSVNNWNVSTRVYFSVDSINPVVLITIPTNTTYNYKPTLNFTVSDAGGLDKCWYINKTGQTNQITSCLNVSSSLFNVTEGWNNITVYVNDTVGNMNSSAVNFTYDVTYPTITIQIPTNTTYGYKPTLNFTVTDNGAISQCWYINKTGQTNKITNCANVTSVLFNVTEGWNNITVYVNDTVNNTNSSSINFTYDMTAPTLAIQLPQNTTYSYNISLPLNYTATDNVAVSQCKYNLDGGTNITLANCANATFNATGGFHKLYLFANDTSGNNATVNVNFTVSATIISNCSDLTGAGLTYYLGNDIINSSVSKCINISSDNITFDCQGHLIDGDDSAWDGIYIKRTGENANIIVKNCILTDWNDAGIFSSYVNNITLSNITVNSSQRGFYFTYSDSNIISDARADSNSWGGLYSENSNIFTINNSIFINNGFFDIAMDTSIANDDCDYTFINVTGTDNKPIIFYNNTVTINGWNNNVSEIILCKADNSIINNVTLQRTSTKTNGILVVATSSANISNISTTNIFAVKLVKSKSNNISKITGNSNVFGVWLEYSDYNVVTNASVSSSNIAVETFGGNYNNVSEVVSNNNNYCLIVFAGSSNNTYHDIKCYGSKDYDIDYNDANNNIFYNNLFNSSVNVHFYNNLTYSYWNTTQQSGTRIYSNGVQIGGNYYTNETNNGYSDICNDTNTDGFCDNPYDVSAKNNCTAGVTCGNNTDYLPLSNKYALGNVDINWSFGTGITKVSYRYDDGGTPPTPTNPLIVNATGQTTSIYLFNVTNNGTLAGSLQMRINITRENVTDECFVNAYGASGVNLSTSFSVLNSSLAAQTSNYIWCRRWYNSSSFDIISVGYQFRIT